MPDKPLSRRGPQTAATDGQGTAGGGPAQAALPAHPLNCVDPALFSADNLVHPDHLMMFAADREGFVEDVARQSFGGWDLLTLSGFWIDSDNLDVSHGACGRPCGHVPADASLDLGRHGFAEARRRYLQAIPEKSLLVRVRGHY